MVARSPVGRWAEGGVSLPKQQLGVIFWVGWAEGRGRAGRVRNESRNVFLALCHSTNVTSHVLERGRFSAKWWPLGHSVNRYSGKDRPGRAKVGPCGVVIALYNIRTESKTSRSPPSNARGNSNGRSVLPLVPACKLSG